MKYLFLIFGAVGAMAIAVALIVTQGRTPRTDGTNTLASLGAPPSAPQMPGAPAADPAFAEAQQRALTELRAQDGWQATGSGLRWRRLSGQGNGRHPTVNDTVAVKYSGRLVDGTVFDSSEEPVALPLASLIPGWQEGIPLMSPGERFEFAVPANLAYGEGQGPIPPGATLFFQVELVAINPGAGGAGR